MEKIFHRSFFAQGKISQWDIDIEPFYFLLQRFLKHDEALPTSALGTFMDLGVKVNVTGIFNVIVTLSYTYTYTYVVSFISVSTGKHKNVYKWV